MIKFLLRSNKYVSKDFPSYYLCYPERGFPAVKETNLKEWNIRKHFPPTSFCVDTDYTLILDLGQPCIKCITSLSSTSCTSTPQKLKMTFVPVLVAELLCPSSEYWYGYCRGSSDPGKYCKTKKKTNKKKTKEEWVTLEWTNIASIRIFIPKLPWSDPKPSYFYQSALCINGKWLHLYIFTQNALQTFLLLIHPLSHTPVAASYHAGCWPDQREN